MEKGKNDLFEASAVSHIDHAANDLKFRSLFDNSTVAIFETNAVGKCLLVNKQWCNFAGLTPDEAEGDGWQQALHPDDRERISNLWNEYAREKKTWNFEYRFCTPDQKITWVLGTTIPLINEQGEITGYLGINTDITDRKRAEEARIRSEQLYRLLFDNNLDAFLLTAPDGRIQSVNPATCEMFGRTSEEMCQIGRSGIMDISDPRLKVALDQRTRTGRFIGELTCLRKDETKFPVELSSTVFTDFDGKQCTGMIIRDITERKLAEEALRESEERFRFLLQNISSVSVQGYSPDGTTQYWNIASEEIYGYTAQEAIGRNLLELIIPPEMREGVKQAIKRMAETGEAIPSSELSLMRKDGSRVSVYSSHAIVKIPGHPQELFCFDIDLTNYKRAEAEILKSKKQFDNLVAQIPVGVYILRTKPDFTFELEYVSPVMAEIVGLSVESLLAYNETIFKAIHPDDLEDFSRLNMNGIRQKQPFDWKGRAVVKGVVKWLHISSLPQLQEDGDILWHGLVVDITERMRDEAEIRLKNEELQNLNATKDKFFSIIAHDLRSPFNSILGLTNYMVEQIQEKNFEKLEEYGVIVRNSSQRAMDLLTNLLEWSRSQTGRMEFSPEYIEIGSLIGEVTSLLVDSAEQKSITISQKTSGEIVASVDRSMFSTIMRNLISNAIKFTKVGGAIEISLEEETSYIKVSVKDNGIGIKKDQIEKLFKIDENQSTLGTRNEKGTGLGLILCKEFVDKHGGLIWVESEVGKGSLFCFTIPKH